VEPGQASRTAVFVCQGRAVARRSDWPTAHTTGPPGVPDAIRDLETGQVRGKIAISLPSRE
jgi:hypothetical protein